MALATYDVYEVTHGMCHAFSRLVSTLLKLDSCSVLLNSDWRGKRKDYMSAHCGIGIGRSNILL